MASALFAPNLHGIRHRGDEGTHETYQHDVPRSQRQQRGECYPVLLEAVLQSELLQGQIYPLLPGQQGRRLCLFLGERRTVLSASDYGVWTLQRPTVGMCIAR